jgi:hypothetical protein
VLGGQHDDLDVAVDRLVHATQRRAQGLKAMRRRDGQADERVLSLGGRWAPESGARPAGWSDAARSLLAEG